MFTSKLAELIPFCSGGYHPMGGGPGGYGRHMPFYGAWWFWIVIAILVVVVLGWLLRGGKTDTRSSSSLDILKERYAKGEISKEEFEEMKRDIL